MTRTLHLSPSDQAAMVAAAQRRAVRVVDILGRHITKKRGGPIAETEDLLVLAAVASTLAARVGKAARERSGLAALLLRLDRDMRDRENAGAKGGAARTRRAVR